MLVQQSLDYGLPQSTIRRAISALLFFDLQEVTFVPALPLGEGRAPSTHRAMFQLMDWCQGLGRLRSGPSQITKWVKVTAE
jgi:hypothetical protein